MLHLTQGRCGGGGGGGGECFNQYFILVVKHCSRCSCSRLLFDKFIPVTELHVLTESDIIITPLWVMDVYVAFVHVRVCAI